MQTKKEVKIALIQHSCNDAKEDNLSRAKSLIREAANEGAKIICTQELFNGTYFPQTIDETKYNWAEPVDGPTWTEVQALSKELGVVIICSLYEHALDGVYFNTVVVYEEGKALGKYRKHHIPEAPQYIEKYYFTPGNTGYPVFKTKYGTIGVLICWDEWFPEPSRIVAMKGADIIFYPSAIGSLPEEPDFDCSPMWIDAIKAHGIHNNIFTAAVNRVGVEHSNEGFMSFYGSSFVGNPFGEIISKAKTKEDEIIYADIDFSQVKRARDFMQFFRDRRPDSYGELLNITIENK
jgi:N-carbamoylputrescine amidase